MTEPSVEELADRLTAAREALVLRRKVLLEELATIDVALSRAPELGRPVKDTATRVDRILVALAERGGLTADELRTVLGDGSRSLPNTLSQLIRRGKVRTEGRRGRGFVGGYRYFLVETPT